jgi:photosystem II stability/assembly factor-like uncharacterized protein
MRSRLGSGHLTPVTLPRPLGTDGAQPDLAASASTVTVLNTLRPSTRSDAAEFETSSDDGAVWRSVTAPCERELGGQLSVADGSTWAMCATGLEAQAFRLGPDSTAAHPAFGRSLSNESLITGVTDTSATISTVGNRVLWTSNSGRSWRRSQLPNRNRYWYLSDETFPSASAGYAIDSGPHHATILHTSNRGRTWTVLPLPTLAAAR